MQITPLTGALGAEITGVDARDPATFPALKEELARFGVIAIREQSLTPDEHLAVAGRFGPVVTNRFFAHVPGIRRWR